MANNDAPPIGANPAAQLTEMVKSMQADAAKHAGSGGLRITGLGELDAYFLQAIDEEGTTTTGVCFRARVAPYTKIMLLNPVPVTTKMGELLDARLPPPPAPTKPMAHHQRTLRPKHILPPSASEMAQGTVVRGEVPLDSAAIKRPGAPVAAPKAAVNKDEFGVQEE